MIGLTKTFTIFNVAFITIALMAPVAYAATSDTHQSNLEDALYAQYAFKVENGSRQKIFTDKSNVRLQPSLSAPVIDKLAAGQEVEIVQQAAVLKLGNRAANWYKIRYDKNHKTFVGYIWGANLSLGYRQLQGYTFLFGTQPSPDKNDNTNVNNVNLAVSVLKNDQLEQTIYFDAYADSLSMVHFDWGRDVGIKGVTKLLVAGVSGEACGIPSVNKNMLWDGGRLVELPTAESVSDAGVFYHDEDYIFPSDENGVAGHIIMQMQEGSGEELVNGNYIIRDEVVKRTVYKWQVDRRGKHGRLVKVD